MSLSRRRALQVAGITGFSVIAARLVQFEAFEAEARAKDARRTRQTTTTLRALRGEIQDRNGIALASSMLVYDVAVNQLAINQYEHVVKDDNGVSHIIGRGALEAAAQLAPLLDMDARELGAKMIGDSTYVVIAKAIDQVVWRKIDALSIQGIEQEQRVKRLYPAGNVASNIVGYAHDEKDEGSKNRYVKAETGLELTQDKLLTGTDGYWQYERSSSGQFIIPYVPERTVPALQGSTVRTTLNADLQKVVQDIVAKAMTTWSPEWISVLVTEPATGKVIVMADSGSFDPTNPDATANTGTRTVEVVYEPGSVGKVVTFAAALEEQKTKPEDTWNVPDYWSAPNGQVFEDSHHHGTIQMTTTKVLVDSSNVGTVQIGDRLDDAVRHEYMRKFGWGELTGIELPGESPGLLSEAATWDGRTRYTTMFGQGVACTPLQAVQTLATIANGGVRVPLRVVDSWVAPDGARTEQSTPEGIRVISEETAKTLTEMLIEVTQKGGTAQTAAVDGYLVAGKTGTTEVIEGGTQTGNVASFVGFLPARAPAAAVSVIVHKPAHGIYGGVIAAPIFREVALATMHALGISPDPSVVASPSQ
ncbi:Penicillin-binding protein 2 [Actinomyces bovis]|uniref:Penicillin-binding protein 2 n=1 Tax=Actinomyces bovis TaxID=1658 RepID=A0ABY1VP72_9ACTO|nr:penicillin-binding protein 2 [Actinomyces bovis]SPT53926.1 Penicillin-binding protein 2 [Actinomyces bovis]VEG53416.1 Penicillin-binding protein 2 [Actinomyces israelii]